MQNNDCLDIICHFGITGSALSDIALMTVLAHLTLNDTPDSLSLSTTVTIATITTTASTINTKTCLTYCVFMAQIVFISWNLLSLYNAFKAYVI